MRNQNCTALPIRLRLITLAVAACFASEPVLANPTGHAVVNGSVAVVPMGNVLQITNTPNSIINWQSFSINAGEITRFVQQSNSSAVLNRVITQNPSTILGALQSNGRVFLVNPSGILFGAGAQIDVAGLIASTLNLSDADFLASRLKFTDGLGAGSVVNQGNITTPAGGNIYLVGPAVTNSGIITSPQGEVVLAAGNTVELVDAGTPNLRVEILAPDNQALNMGQIIADSGRVGIYAGLINQSGTVRANTAMVTVDGRIVLKATNNANFSTGSSTMATGPLQIEAGDITVAGNVTSGPQTINASGGLNVQSSAAGSALLQATGGQTINAGFIEVTAQDNNFAGIANSTSGNQIITVAGGGSSPGIDVQALASGGSASIANNAPGAAQSITVTDADHINVNGFGPNFTNVSAIIHAIPGTQTISITGSGANAINVGSAGALGGSIVNARSQNINAGASGQSGSITITGSAVNTRFAAILTNLGFPGTQTVSTSGALTITGGSAPAQNSSSGIGHNSTGPQTVTAASITLEGGLSGNGNGVQIRSAIGDQAISASSIAITGGSMGNSNFAEIRQSGAAGIQSIDASSIKISGGASGSGNSANMGANNNGSQFVTIGEGGILLTGGTGGTNNSAFVTGTTQTISTTGDVTLRGGAGIGNGPRLGGPSGAATNLALSASGNVLLETGSASSTAAVIGNPNTGTAQPTSIAINAGGSVILNAGSFSGVRIGQSENVPGAGGDISINAGGGIQLNGTTTQLARIRTPLGNVELHADKAGGTISETPNGFVHANQLTTTSNAGTSLIGQNQVAGFNAKNAAIGDIAFNNTGSLALMASNTAPGGKITANNSTGDLATSGPISASGGGSADVSLTAGGAINIAHPVTATGTGDIALTGNAIAVNDTSVIAGGSVTVNGTSLDVKGVSAGALIQAGDAFNANLSGDLRVRAASADGGFGGWATILSDGPVDISAGNVMLEGGKKLGGFAAITGGPVNVTTTGDFSVTGGSGFGSFGMLLSSQNIGLTVGGSLRLDSGTGLGSFARLQTLYPWSTISLHFPDLESGGYFVNGVEGRISQGLTGFFTGVKPAKPGKTLITTYGN